MFRFFAKVRNYQELSNLDQITTVMSDHNNLRVEINFKENYVHKDKEHSSKTRSCTSENCHNHMMNDEKPNYTS